MARQNLNAGEAWSVLRGKINANDTELYAAVATLDAITADTDEPNGFIRSLPDTMGDLAFNESTREITLDVHSGESEFVFYSAGVKFSKTSQEAITIADTTGLHFVYFDAAGAIQQTTTFSEALLTEYAIVFIVYRNATTSDTIIPSDERHGVQMAGYTHLYNHRTRYTVYDLVEGGLDIVGLVDGDTTFTQVTSGLLWDEDIPITIPVQNTQEFWYRNGSVGAWEKTAADNAVGYNGGSGDCYWNENTSGTIWQLTRSGNSTDYIIYFTLGVPDLVTGGKVIKLIGQSAYSSRTAAREAIETEIRNITLAGLPAPEFKFLHAYIVRRNMDLEDLADGGTYVDLRTEAGGGSGSSSGVQEPFTQSFEDADLDGSFEIELTHGLGRLPVSVLVTDDSGKNVGLSFTNTTTTITLELGAAITGTWNCGAI